VSSGRAGAGGGQQRGTAAGATPYYAQAFSPMPGRCFRLVAHDGEAGPTHCPDPVAWRGHWRASNGHRYQVEACEGHRPPIKRSGIAT
jgi:hypothetical protein